MVPVCGGFGSSEHNEELMMRARLILFAAFVLVASPVFAQTTPRTPRTPPTAPTPPAPPASSAPAVSAPVPPPPPPPPPGPPQRAGQPINVKIELNISEDGGGMPPAKKTVSAVVGDGFSGYVREQFNNPMAGRFVPLNLDAYPVILPNGKVRLTCTIQYFAAPGPSAVPLNDREQAAAARTGTEIKQNLVLIFESGKALVISQATDPVSDRKVTVEVTATILR
jgi:hypothetical protein